MDILYRDTVGFDVEKLTAIFPVQSGVGICGHTHDFMSYGGSLCASAPNWVSDASYMQMFNTLTRPAVVRAASAGARAAADGPAVVVGAIRRRGQPRRSSRLSSRTRRLSPAGTAGTHAFELVDQAGNVLAARRTTPDMHAGRTAAAIGAALPCQARATALRPVGPRGRARRAAAQPVGTPHQAADAACGGALEPRPHGLLGGIGRRRQPADVHRSVLRRWRRHVDDARIPAHGIEVRRRRAAADRLARLPRARDRLGRAEQHAGHVGTVRRRSPPPDGGDRPRRTDRGHPAGQPPGDGHRRRRWDGHGATRGLALQPRRRPRPGRLDRHRRALGGPPHDLPHADRQRRQPSRSSPARCPCRRSASPRRRRACAFVAAAPSWCSHGARPPPADAGSSSTASAAAGGGLGPRPRLAYRQRAGATASAGGPA